MRRIIGWRYSGAGAPKYRLKSLVSARPADSPFSLTSSYIVLCLPVKGLRFFNRWKRGSATVAKSGIKRRYQLAEPKKLRSLQIFRGAGRSKIEASLLRPTLTPSLLMWNPRYFISLRKNRHFSGLIEIPAEASRSNTFFNYLRWFLKILLTIMTSSK